MTRFLHNAIRFLGIVVGLLMLVIGPLILWQEGTFSRDLIGFCIVSIPMGAVFLWYGVKGRPFRVRLSPRFLVFVCFLVGLAFIALGAYYLYVNDSHASGMLIGTLYILIGGANVWLSQEIRKF